jgi:FlaA1/EpsC-like NDP-sugar epimerase
LPGIGELIDGRVSVKLLRDISYEDLLGRSSVHLNIKDIRNYLDGKTILITGCGGSIGSELCRQVMKYQPRNLILLDSSESNLFNIQMEMQNENYCRHCEAILGRVQDETLMNNIFEKYKPEVVFHAAAYKHVPMLEKNPWQAVFNNIIGSRVVMEMAVKHHVDRFVLVSTDKAVRPTNVMGTSKRVTELIMQCQQGNGTRFMAVRFGNVVGSSGSVIPLFRRQIEQGGPVTVTHPEVNRFFMTISEASQMILQAGTMGEGGEIFILRMGTPVKIADMARDLIRLSGKEPDVDIKIVYTGLRKCVFQSPKRRNCPDDIADIA